LLAAAATTADAENANSKSLSGALNASYVAMNTDQPEDILIRQFVGSGDRRTLGFSVGGSWELRWRAQPMTQFDRLGGFRAEIYDVATNRLLGSIGDNARNGSGTERVSQDGRFYLKVTSRNVNWEIDIVDIEDPWLTAGHRNQADFDGRLVLIQDQQQLEVLRALATGGA
jgi:hypothetical protein